MDPETLKLLESLRALKEAGIGANIITALAVGFVLWKLRQIDARLRAVIAGMQECPGCKKHLRLPVEPLILAVAACLLSGCTSVRQEVETQETATNGTVSVRTVKARAVTLFDGRSVVREMRLSGGKTASIGVEGQETEAHGTNATATIDALSRLLMAVPK